MVPALAVAPNKNGGMCTGARCSAETAERRPPVLKMAERRPPVHKTVTYLYFNRTAFLI